MAAKARIEKLTPPSASSFIYKIRRESHFGAYWHFHPEYQLTLITRGRGRRFVGDDVAPFREGDLVLTGPNLPHMWCSDRRSRGTDRPHEARIVQFSSAIYGERFLRLPEMAPISRLLDRSARGIRFDGAVRDRVRRKLATMGAVRGPARLIELLDILRVLSESPAPPCSRPGTTSPPRRSGTGSASTASAASCPSAPAAGCPWPRPRPPPT